MISIKGLVCEWHFFTKAKRTPPRKNSVLIQHSWLVKLTLVTIAVLSIKVWLQRVFLCKVCQVIIGYGSLSWPAWAGSEK